MKEGTTVFGVQLAGDDHLFQLVMTLELQFDHAQASTDLVDEPLSLVVVQRHRILVLLKNGLDEEWIQHLPSNTGGDVEQKEQFS